MRDRGGYILHIDGTCEEGSRVLLVCLDSVSGQVLESRKISSENAEEVEQVLRARTSRLGLSPTSRRSRSTQVVDHLRGKVCFQEWLNSSVTSTSRRTLAKTSFRLMSIVCGTCFVVRRSGRNFGPSAGRSRSLPPHGTVQRTHPQFDPGWAIEPRIFTSSRLPKWFQGYGSRTGLMDPGLFPLRRWIRFSVRRTVSDFARSRARS